MSISNLLVKLAKFQDANLSVGKDAQNPFFKSKYATLENILEVITPKLNELKLVITHNLENRTVMTSVYDSESGESIHSSFPVFGEKPQEIGSSISYARRYNIVALFNLSVDQDDDGNAANAIAIPKSKTLDEEINQEIPASQDGCKVCGSEMTPGKNGKPYCVPCYKKWAAEHKK